MSEKHNYQLQRWKLLIEERTHSGMTVIEWCNANGLSRHAYYYWLDKLREENFLEAVQNLPAQVQLQTAFVEIQRPVPSASEAQSLSAHKPAAILRKGDLQVDLFPNASSDFLKLLMEAVHYVPA